MPSAAELLTQTAKQFVLGWGLVATGVAVSCLVLSRDLQLGLQFFGALCVITLVDRLFTPGKGKATVRALGVLSLYCLVRSEYASAAVFTRFFERLFLLAFSTVVGIGAVTLVRTAVFVFVCTFPSASGSNNSLATSTTAASPTMLVRGKFAIGFHRQGAGLGDSAQPLLRKPVQQRQHQHPRGTDVDRWEPASIPVRSPAQLMESERELGNGQRAYDALAPGTEEAPQIRTEDPEQPLSKPERKMTLSPNHSDSGPRGSYFILCDSRPLTAAGLEPDHLGVNCQSPRSSCATELPQMRQPAHVPYFQPLPGHSDLRAKQSAPGPEVISQVDNTPASPSIPLHSTKYRIPRQGRARYSGDASEWELLFDAEPASRDVFIANMPLSRTTSGYALSEAAESKSSTESGPGDLAADVEWELL